MDARSILLVLENPPLVHYGKETPVWNAGQKNEHITLLKPQSNSPSWKSLSFCEAPEDNHKNNDEDLLCA